MQTIGARGALTTDAPRLSDAWWPFVAALLLLCGEWIGRRLVLGDDISAGRIFDEDIVVHGGHRPLPFHEDLILRRIISRNRSSNRWVDCENECAAQCSGRSANGFAQGNRRRIWRRAGVVRVRDCSIRCAQCRTRRRRHSRSRLHRGLFCLTAKSCLRWGRCGEAQHEQGARG